MFPDETNSYRFGTFTFIPHESLLLRDGSPVSLTPKTFDLLAVLVKNRGRVVGKDELMSTVWPDTIVEEGNLAVTIRHLRKTLGDDAHDSTFIETVPRRGYRFIAEVQVPQSKENDEPEQSESSVETENGDISPARRYKYWLLFPTGAVLLFLTGASWFIWLRPFGAAQPTQLSQRKTMLAVLPFQNLTGDNSQEYFSDGLTEEMITRLGSIEPNRLGVIGRTSVMHYKSNPATIDQIGRELQVQYVLEGSVRRDANRVRVAAQLIQTSDQTHVWAQEYDREITDLLSLQDEIAQEVAVNIESTLGTDKGESTQKSDPEGFEAYDLYLKGQYFFNKRGDENLRQAIGYFERSSNADPRFARAYAGLAASYALLSGYSSAPQSEFIAKARAAADRALAIDPNLSEAHTALALIVQNYDWDWQTAEKEFQRAIELNPNYATAHHWYAEHLALLGRFDEALHESELARQLDPFSMVIATDNGEILYFSRQHDRAIQKLREVQEMEPEFSRAHIVIHPYVEKGMFKEALADLEQMSKKANGLWIWAEMAYVCGRSGRPADAQRAVNKLLELNRQQTVDASLLVWAYTGMGNKEQAFAWLEKAYDQHSNVLVRLKVDPAYDSLRDDPRFQDLLARVRFAN